MRFAADLFAAVGCSPGGLDADDVFRRCMTRLGIGGSTRTHVRLGGWKRTLSLDEALQAWCDGSVSDTRSRWYIMAESSWSRSYAVKWTWACGFDVGFGSRSWVERGAATAAASAVTKLPVPREPP
ncbi:hypothetical protein P171DRAFT_145468 [Karstenula rhodostoma CBS 690.94]|uniref:Uncharacterized protein n=1 Tax=Karstenula rhodostoma CBS 690.94 TaxID=1392251 RepID=A0A9P4PV00_9PLEO|nr:hypothetical protein P171DRAFT_145468 [Karstenula rhodostoma CBS 690.94]